MNNKFYLATNESSLSDPCYRYQINNPIITVSGKQGNRTTFFENSESFAKSINRDSEIIGKFIGCKIASSMKFDKDKNCLSFKGEYDATIIINHLNEFIKIFVLCPGCDYPETNLKLNIKKFLYHECKACGKENEINTKFIDKTYEFIIKKIK